MSATESEHRKTHYAAPPHDWVLQQCRLFFQIKKQYGEKYAGQEALARADMCIDRVFCEWAGKEQHKHRRGYLQELRSFLREHVSMEEILAESDNLELLAQKYAAMLDYHFDALLYIAMVTVFKDLGVNADSLPASNVLLAQMETARAEWNSRRSTAKKEVAAATKEHNYEKLHLAKTKLDQAEKMCSYYAHAIAKTKKSIMLNEIEKKEAEKVEDEKVVDAEEEKAEKNGPFVAFLKSDKALAAAAEYVTSVLKQYVDPTNPILHEYAAGVERMAFVEAAALVPQSPILSTIAALSSGGKTGKLISEKTQIHTLVSQWTSRLKEGPFMIARGINDRRGQVIREQKLGQFNNVCRSVVDANVLRGIGRSFSGAEFQAPQNVNMLFCAEPGCFHIDFYHTNPDFVNPKPRTGKHEFAIEIRLQKPHITLSHTVLAPGYYLLDQTIFMPGIDRGRAVAVASHLLHSATGMYSSTKKKQTQHQLPAYMTAEYDAQQVEALVKQGRWEEAQTSLVPTKILHAGNATLFLAASSTDFETLGFIVVGSAGRCMMEAPNVDNTDGGVGKTKSAYSIVDETTFTKSQFCPAEDGHDNALYIDALCGITNTKAKTTRGVGFCLMAHALAYCARSQPTGILMRVRNGTPPLNSAIDASVAFYYYSHFGMQCVSSNVARDVGFLALAEHYKGQKTVSKRVLKDDNLYAHVRNILSTLHGIGSADEEKQSDEIDVDLICGKKNNTLPNSFVNTIYKHDETALSNVLYRQYPHVSEIYDRIVAHITMLNGGTLPLPTNGGTLNSSSKAWNLIEDYQFENDSKIAGHEGGDVSESIGGGNAF